MRPRAHNPSKSVRQTLIIHRSFRWFSYNCEIMSTVFCYIVWIQLSKLFSWFWEALGTERERTEYVLDLSLVAWRFTKPLLIYRNGKQCEADEFAELSKCSPNCTFNGVLRIGVLLLRVVFQITTLHNAACHSRIGGLLVSISVSLEKQIRFRIKLAATVSVVPRI